jgi:hypothetical protein
MTQKSFAQSNANGSFGAKKRPFDNPLKRRVEKHFFQLVFLTKKSENFPTGSGKVGVL